MSQEPNTAAQPINQDQQPALTDLPHAQNEANNVQTGETPTQHESGTARAVRYNESGTAQDVRYNESGTAQDVRYNESGTAQGTARAQCPLLLVYSGGFFRRFRFCFTRRFLKSGGFRAT